MSPAILAPAATAAANKTNVEIDKADLIPVIQAQRICTEHLGTELPLHLLVGIAVRSLHSTQFAQDVLSTITNQEFPQIGDPTKTA